MKPLPKFTAVVHVLTEKQAIEQTGLALGAGAGGVFLIDHEADCHALEATYRRVRGEFPQAWIGINFLGLDGPAAVTMLPTDADALWMDDMGDLDPIKEATACPARLFAGAAFKYQPKRGTPEQEATTLAARLRTGDVVTTSGPGTGKSATSEKLRAMKAAAGNSPLALASGVTPENVAQYRDYVDCFLVATGIAAPGSFHEFDPLKVRRLADRLAE